MKNPSQRAINELYGFLEHGNMPITADGCFIAYKSVRTDFKDVHTGTYDNTPGNVHEMPYEHVDPNCEQHCSTGFHVGSYEYASTFGGGNLILVKVNPADAVSVPTDHDAQKLRVCRYEVISLCQGLIQEPTYGKLEEDSNPFEEGYNAYYSGGNYSDNPYGPDTYNDSLWQDGWDQAIRESEECDDGLGSGGPSDADPKPKRPACAYCGSKGGKAHKSNCNRWC